jgi:hypothetical protein
MVLKMMMTPEKWCLPAIIYGAIVILTIATIFLMKYPEGKEPNMKEKILLSIYELCIGFIVLVIMLMCCEANKEWIPWLILLVPIFFALGKLSKCKT